MPRGEEHSPPVFVSCSFQPDDQDVVTFYQRVLRALGLLPVTARPDALPSPEKVRKAITDATAVVAILTRRGEAGTDNTFNSPDWVQQEMALAYGLGKPIALLVENGVTLHGLFKATDPVVFERERLHDSVPDVIMLLLSLMDQITPSWQTPPYLLKKQAINIDLRKDGSYGLEGEFVLQAVQGGIQTFDNFLNTWFGGKYTLEGTTVAVKPDPRADPKHRVTCTISAIGQQRVAFAYRFDPPLQKGDEVSWKIDVNVPHPALPMTQKDITELLAAGEYPVDRIIAVDGWLVVPPTSELEITWEFPSGYLPKDEDIMVHVGTLSDGFALEDELRRLRERGALERLSLKNHTALKLKVSRPLSGYLYGINWDPPS